MFAFPVRMHSPARGQGEGVPAFGDAVLTVGHFSLVTALAFKRFFIKSGSNYSPAALIRNNRGNPPTAYHCKHRRFPLRTILCSGLTTFYGKYKLAPC